MAKPKWMPKRYHQLWFQLQASAFWYETNSQSQSPKSWGAFSLTDYCTVYMILCLWILIRSYHSLHVVLIFQLVYYPIKKSWPFIFISLEDRCRWFILLRFEYYKKGKKTHHLQSWPHSLCQQPLKASEVWRHWRSHARVKFFFWVNFLSN